MHADVLFRVIPMTHMLRNLVSEMYASSCRFLLHKKVTANMADKTFDIQIQTMTQGWVSAHRNLFLPDMWFKPVKTESHYDCMV